MYFFDNILLNSCRMINVQTRVAAKIKANILCPIILFSLWDNGDKRIIHCCFSTATMVSQTRHNVTLYGTMPILCTFTLVLPYVCVQCTVWLLSVDPWCSACPGGCWCIFWIILRWFQLPRLLLVPLLFVKSRYTVFLLYSPPSSAAVMEE